MNQIIAVALGLTFLLPIVAIAEQRCQLLPQCESMMQLVRNKDRIPGMTRSQVFAILRAASCGIEGNIPKVMCEMNEEEEDLEEAEQIVARDAGVTSLLSGSQQCQGVLKLHTMSQDGTYTIGTLRLTRDRYRQLRKLDSKYVYSTRVNGNCCWTITERSYFRGRQTSLAQNSIGGIEIQPKAAKKTICT